MPRGRTSAALTPLEYPAEIVPLVDPYTVGVGGIVPVRALVGGRPLPGWTLRAGGTIGTSTVSIPAQELTTDADGRVEVRLTHDGHWFVAFVHMVEGERGSGFDYVSRWARSRSACFRVADANFQRPILNFKELQLPNPNPDDPPVGTGSWALEVLGVGN